MADTVSSTSPPHRILPRVPAWGCYFTRSSLPSSTSLLAFLRRSKSHALLHDAPASTMEILQRIRGGVAGSDDDDDVADLEDDEYDDEDEEGDEDEKEEFDHSLIGPPKPSDRRSTTRPPPMMLPNDQVDARRGSHHQRLPQYPRGQPSSSSSSSSKNRRSSKSAPHWSQQLATQSLQATGSLAWNTFVKQPGRLAYHLIRPKHLDLIETNGLWRLDQQITLKAKDPRRDDDRILASVATIELRAQPRPPTVIVRKHTTGTTTTATTKSSNGKKKDAQQQQQQQQHVVVSETPYTFTKSSRLSGGVGSFKTQFVAPAFLVDDQMRMYGYKGTWQRKLADRRVIKLVGKIYQVHKQRFGKGRGEYVFGPAVGTFVARRRIRMLEEDEEEDDNDEEYEYDDDDEWEEIDEYEQDEDDESEEY